MTWRVAGALLTLREEIDDRWPDRERTSDGTIGDTAHQAQGSSSDHNPWVTDARGIGVVRALDVDAGPGLFPDRSHDTVGDTVSEVVRGAGKNGHPALGDGSYVIYEGKIASALSNPPWSWRKHSGDAHESHPHISVGKRESAFDSKAGWGIRDHARVQTPASRTPLSTEFPLLQLGSSGEFVKLLQRFLFGSARAKTMHVYGRFEATTDSAVRAYQRMRGLDVDGVVGTDTWRPIRTALHL
jgi:peptidoglycan hydrolase-like protein with peptidoglycan-binding domain